jgi:hypothetical protein
MNCAKGRAEIQLSLPSILQCSFDNLIWTSATGAPNVNVGYNKGDGVNYIEVGVVFCVGL